MQDRLVDPDKEMVQRIGGFRAELSAHEIEHQHRNQCYRQDGSKRHRICFGKCERAEQAIAFTCERKHRQERHCDDEQ